MEVAEYISQGKAVVLEYAREGATESRNALVKEARGDSLSLLIDGACSLGINNGDRVFVRTRNPDMTIEVEARVIGNTTENTINLRAVGKKGYGEGSEGFSVCDTIPFSYIKVSQDTYERYKNSHKPAGVDEFLSDLWRRTDYLKRDDVEPSLYQCLIDINQKLNLIIRHISSQGKGEEVIPPERELDISASGIRFDAEEEFCAGDILKIKIILPAYPIAFLTLFSEVKKVDRLENGKFEVYTAYSGLNAEAKDQIITYLFKRQREAIRSEKG